MFIAICCLTTIQTCGAFHTAVLTAQGDVYTFGLNADMQLGRVTKLEFDETPVKVQNPSF